VRHSQSVKLLCLRPSRAELVRRSQAGLLCGCSTVTRRRTSSTTTHHPRHCQHAGRPPTPTTPPLEPLNRSGHLSVRQPCVLSPTAGLTSPRRTTYTVGCSCIYHLLFFYRATLCISAVLAVDECPSVCLTVTPAYYFKTAKDIVVLLLDLITPSFQFLDPKLRYPIQREPINGGAKYTGCENLRFSTEIAFLSLKQYEIGPWFLWNVNRKSR